MSKVFNEWDSKRSMYTPNVCTNVGICQILFLVVVPHASIFVQLDAEQKAPGTIM